VIPFGVGDHHIHLHQVHIDAHKRLFPLGILLGILRRVLPRGGDGGEGQQ